MSRVLHRAPVVAMSVPSAAQDASPFLDPRDALVLRRRRRNEGRLRAAMARVGPVVMSLAQDAEALRREGREEEADAQIAKAKAFIEETTVSILFPKSRAGERAAYLEKFGCTAWTSDALATLLEAGPLVELGAGGGQWHRALKAAHPQADIVSYDNFSAVPTPDVTAPHRRGGVAAAADSVEGPVRRGGIEVLARHSDRSLFLCYPPPGPMAHQALKAFKGSTVVYVGEGVGGCNGDAAWFEELIRAWEVERVVPLRPFAGGCERMYVLRRRSNK